MAKCSEGKILLQRKENSFEAGFCIINSTFQELVKDISSLHPNELDYFKKLRFEKRKVSYLLGRLAAKKAINTIFQIGDSALINIDFGIFQFPVIKSSFIQNIQITITHCGNIGIAIAFPEDHPLAIDIEEIDISKTEILKSYLSKNEYLILESTQLPISIGYTFIWTIKESLSKVLKTGLTCDFKLLEIQSFKQTDLVYISTFVNFMQYKALSYHSGNYIISIILPKHTSPELNIFLESFDEAILNCNNEY